MNLKGVFSEAFFKEIDKLGTSPDIAKSIAGIKTKFFDNRKLNVEEVAYLTHLMEQAGSTSPAIIDARRFTPGHDLFEQGRVNEFNPSHLTYEANLQPTAPPNNGILFKPKPMKQVEKLLKKTNVTREDLQKALEIIYHNHEILSPEQAAYVNAIDAQLLAHGRNPGHVFQFPDPAHFTPGSNRVQFHNPANLALRAPTEGGMGNMGGLALVGGGVVLVGGSAFLLLHKNNPSPPQIPADGMPNGASNNPFAASQSGIPDQMVDPSQAYNSPPMTDQNGSPMGQVPANAYDVNTPMGSMPSGGMNMGNPYPSAASMTPNPFSSMSTPQTMPMGGYASSPMMGGYGAMPTMGYSPSVIYPGGTTPSAANPQVYTQQTNVLQYNPLTGGNPAMPSMGMLEGNPGADSMPLTPSVNPVSTVGPINTPNAALLNQAFVRTFMTQ